MMDIEDRQWKARAVAAELVAQALDVLKSGGNDEHAALSALEDALETRRTAWQQALGR
jgi:hypothetical protein